MQFEGVVGTQFDNTSVDKVTNEGGDSRAVGKFCEVLQNIAKPNIKLATLRHHTQQLPTLATLE